jgi:hypothetical protein
MSHKQNTYHQTINKIAFIFFLGFFISWGFFTPGIVLAEGTPRQAFLVQNSGWMEPFFKDPDSPMMPLLAALGDHLAIGGELSVASFNQDGHIPGRATPHVVYQGSFKPGVVRQALVDIDLPRRPDGHYADSDFQGALIGAINNILEGRAGVIWMITNNRVAPDNDPRVIENTRAFFHQLSNSPAITQLTAYPLRMPVTGPLYSENGLIIYGIGYGEQGGALLKALTERIDKSGLFSNPAVMLKPFDTIPLRFIPSRVHPEELSVLLRDNVLLIEGIECGKPQEILIEGQLQSDFYPHIVDQADSSVVWSAYSTSGYTGQVQAVISPSVINDLQPLDQGVTVILRIRTSSIQRPEGFEGLFVDRTDVSGFLDINLQNVSLSFSEAFSDKMERLYGLDQLPSLFFDNKEITSSKASIPVRLTVHYSIFPLIISLGVIAAVVFGVIGFIFFTRIPRTDTVQVGDMVRKVSLRPFQSQIIRDRNSGINAKVMMGLTGKASVKVIDNQDLS